jgi:branched-chain amino acid transport system substrate-binding protein
MKTPSDTKQYSRRDFLRLAGLAVGGLVASGLTAPAASARSLIGSPRIGTAGRVGLLLPTSTLHPDLVRNFLAGLQLADAGHVLDLVVRETGAGAPNAYEAAQQLINKEGVQRLVGMVDALTLSYLRNTLEARQATLLAVSLGENLSRLTKADARVTVHSLDLVQSAVAFGTWAARSLGRTAVLAASCYDSGYDAFAAFRLGFENAGGRVLHTAITHQPSGGPTVAATLDAIAKARPAFVYASYAGPAAVEWVRAYSQAGLAGSIPLAGSAFLAHESLFAAQGKAAQGILTAAPTQADFAHAYEAQTGRTADLLALLGYETARLLTGQPTGPRVVAVREVQRQGGALVNTVRETLNTLAAGDPSVATLDSKLHSGWLYPYLGA